MRLSRGAPALEFAIGLQREDVGIGRSLRRRAMNAPLWGSYDTDGFWRVFAHAGARGCRARDVAATAERYARALRAVARAARAHERFAGSNAPRCFGLSCARRTRRARGAGRGEEHDA